MHNQHVIAHYDLLVDQFGSLADSYALRNMDKEEALALDHWFENYVKASQNRRSQHRWLACEEHVWAWEHDIMPFDEFY